MALAAVPLIVHLLARSRPPEHQFSDITFLKNIIKKSSRYRKPKDRLVLILRTLAALALLFAFLHPFLVSKDPDSVAGADKNIVLVIDQSASMAAIEGSTPRFSEACNEAATILNKLDPDNANIIWINATPDSVFPAPGPNIKFLTEKLQQAEPTSENGAITPAIKLAIDQLNKVKGNREIILISDFQKRAWENAEVFVPESIKFTKLAVGKSKLPNVGIDTLVSSPTSPVSGQSVAITARVINYSDEPKTTIIYLNAGGGRQSKEVELLANGQSEVEFSTQFNHHGKIAISASLTEDEYRGDDQRHMIIPVRETVRLLSHTAQESASAQVLDRLAAALPWLSHTQTRKLPGIGVCDILFVHQWNGKDIDTLTELSYNGTSVIVSPSSSCQTESLQQLLDLASVDLKLSQIENPQGWKANMAKESAAVFSIFSSGEFGNPAQGRFRQRYMLPKEWSNASIINYSDGVPGIVITKKESASRLLWNLSFDPEHSDWISQEPFVTFMAELLLNIQPSDSKNQHELLIGAPVSWLVPDNVDPSTIKLISASEKSASTIPTELVNTAQGTALQSGESSVPGIYEWRMGQTVANVNFVNFPASESDLTQIDPDDLPSGDTADKEDIIRAEALSQGMPIWPWLLGSVFIFLIAEAFAATTKRNSTQPVSEQS